MMRSIHKGNSVKLLLKVYQFDLKTNAIEISRLIPYNGVTTFAVFKMKITEIFSPCNSHLLKVFNITIDAELSTYLVEYVTKIL